MLLLEVALLYAKSQMTRWTSILFCAFHLLVFSIACHVVLFILLQEIPFWPFPVIFNKNSAYFWFKFRLELTKLLWFVVLVQALALKMALEEKGLSSNVYVGMRYWYPFTEEAVHQVNLWSTVTILHCPCYSHHTFMFFFHN